ncbi:hypothetical protein HIH31_002029 [Escherichia coli]|nr:hypothetical protein [Escherichia coli]
MEIFGVEQILGLCLQYAFNINIVIMTGLTWLCLRSGSLSKSFNESMPVDELISE